MVLDGPHSPPPPEIPRESRRARTPLCPAFGRRPLGGRVRAVMFAPSVRRALKKNKTLRYGVPMMVLIIGGSFGLREFSQIRYDAVKTKLDPEFEEKLKRNKVSLESEYEKIKDSTFDDWKNIRGPRPWEDPDLLQGRDPQTLKSKKA